MFLSSGRPYFYQVVGHVSITQIVWILIETWHPYYLSGGIIIFFNGQLCNILVGGCGTNISRGIFIN